MTKTKKGYKVVSKIADKLFSCIAVGDEPLEKSLILPYEEGKVTKATVGKIFCFDTYGRAREYLGYYVNNREKFEIWEVEMIGGIRKATHRLSTMKLDNIDIVSSFWKEPNTSFPNYRMYDCPAGTYWCNSLRMIKKVS